MHRSPCCIIVVALVALQLSTLVAEHHRASDGLGGVWAPRARYRTVYHLVLVLLQASSPERRKAPPVQLATYETPYVTIYVTIM